MRFTKDIVHNLFKSGEITKMEFLKLAKDQRFSVRKFKDQAVEKEKLDLILEAGRVEPTACNYQPQRILVIEDAQERPGIRTCFFSTHWWIFAFKL